MSIDDRNSQLRHRAKRFLYQVGLHSIRTNGVASALYELFADLKQSGQSIDSKIDEASDSLRRTTELISEIEQTLKDRAQNLALLRDELDRYSALADVEEKKAKAVVQQIELATNKGKVKERWVGFLINIGAGLLLGLILSPTVTTLIQKVRFPNAESTPSESIQPVRSN